MQTLATETLHTLKEMNLTPSIPGEDIRSRKIVDCDGAPLGKIDGLLVDDRDEKVRFLRVGSGGFLGIGKSEALIPVEAITKITEHLVTVNQTRERVAGSPTYDPKLRSEQYYDGIYGYYGYGPFWGTGYVYPSYPYYP